MYQNIWNHAGQKYQIAYCSELVKNCKEKPSGKISLNWRRKCKGIKRSEERDHQKEANIAIKNKFMVAVIVHALASAYLCNEEVYLYGLLVIQNLTLDQEELASARVHEMASAVFMLAITVFGQGLKVPLENFAYHFAGIDPQKIQNNYREVLGRASGISILDVIRQQNKMGTIQQIEKMMRRNALPDMGKKKNKGKYILLGSSNKENDSISSINQSRTL